MSNKHNNKGNKTPPTQKRNPKHPTSDSPAKTRAASKQAAASKKMNDKRAGDTLQGRNPSPVKDKEYLRTNRSSIVTGLFRTSLED